MSRTSFGVPQSVHRRRSGARAVRLNARKGAMRTKNTALARGRQPAPPNLRHTRHLRPRRYSAKLEFGSLSRPKNRGVADVAVRTAQRLDKLLRARGSQAVARRMYQPGASCSASRAPIAPTLVGCGDGNQRTPRGTSRRNAALCCQRAARSAFIVCRSSSLMPTG